MLSRDRSDLAMLRTELLIARRDRIAALGAIESVRGELEQAHVQIAELETHVALLKAEARTGHSVTELNVSRTLAALCESAIELEDGNCTQAAKRLGIDVTTLWRWRTGRTRARVREHLAQRRQA